jgi:hypothetical protein
MSAGKKDSEDKPITQIITTKPAKPPISSAFVKITGQSIKLHRF